MTIRAQTWKAKTAMFAVGCLLCLAQRSPGAPLQGVAPLTVETAPQRVVYEVFLEAVVALDRRAADPAGPAAQRERVQNRMRDVAGLDLSDYQFVKLAAYRLDASLAQIGKRADAILRNPNLSAAAREKGLARFKAERDAAIDAAVGWLRGCFGPTGFEQLDQRVRGHIVPRLKVGPVPNAPREPKR